MIVMKFGGSSIATADGVRRVVDLVRARFGQAPVVVVSAHGGVTDALLQEGRNALQGEQDLGPLRERHAALAAELGVEVPEHGILFDELTDLLRGISFVGELTPRLIDLVSSFGERLSARTVAAAFTKAGIPARAVMAYDAGLTTDARFGRARPLPESDQKIRDHLAAYDELAVVTGFIAMDHEGNVTTVGRNGSDYTAALFAKALGAREIQIWTDVPGVMTADPRLVASARPLQRITFGEAAELAYYGAQVLHPATLEPAVESRIPVRVLDTSVPDREGEASQEGTLIVPEERGSGGPVRAIVHKRGICLLNIVTPRMLGHHGFMARIFEACAQREVALDMIATTEVSVSATVEESHHLGALVEDLRCFAEVVVERQIATIAVVGHGVGDAAGVVNAVFHTLTSHEVPIRMISMGARRTNVGLVVDEDHTADAVRALHHALLEERSQAVGGSST